MIIIASRKDDHDVTNTISQTLLAASPLIVDLEIHDIEGIGLTIARKLKEAGIVSMMDIAVASADEPAPNLTYSQKERCFLLSHPFFSI